MLNSVIAFSLRNKLIVGMAVIAMAAYGGFQVARLPIDAVPDITNNQVQIITVAPSFSATDIERLVTLPVELSVANIKGITEVRSFSRFGLSLVTVVFTDDTDIFLARQQVNERLQALEIPQGVGVPEMGPITTGLGEIYQYVLRAAPGFHDKYDAMALRTIQDWTVRRHLMGVPGVAEVSSFGGWRRQYEVSVNTQRLHASAISIADVFDAIEANNENTGGAYIERGPTTLFIRTEGLIGSLEHLESIAVGRSPSGMPILVSDVAQVREGSATQFGAICYNDAGEVAGGIVMMLKGANSSKVVNDVKEKIDEIRSSLPEGVILEAFLDRTKMVDNAISTVEENLALGALIVVFILVFFLGYIRAGLIVASIIPLSMLFAVIMMNSFGVSGNLMSLGALDFGLIVDGAVIVVEAVMHRLTSLNVKDTPSAREMDAHVQTAAGRMMNSAVFGQIIILVVYLPILSLGGIEGKMFRPMAQTVVFALLGAIILSLTYVPVASALMLRMRLRQRSFVADQMMIHLTRLYRKSLGKAIRKGGFVLGGAAALFVAALLVLTSMGGEFMPTLEEGDFAVEARLSTGSSLAATIEYTGIAARVLLDKFPEVEKVVTKIGSGDVPTDPMPMEAADLMVILRDKKYWTSAASFPELADKMHTALAAVPGVAFGFQFPVQMRFNELMTGARQDVVCKIYGPDLDTLAIYARKIGVLIDDIAGAVDKYVEHVSGVPAVVVDYNRSALARYGISIRQANDVVNMAFAGKSAGKVYEGEKQFLLMVRLDEEMRADPDAIADLMIPAGRGLMVPLHEIASVTIRDSPNQIQRDNTHRRIVVGFNVRGRDVQSIVQELQEAVAHLNLPIGYRVTYGGSFENLQAATQQLLVVVPVVLVLIFLVLYIALRSIKLSAIIFIIIPLSGVGGIFLLSLRGMPFSISAGVGFIALFGIAILNGIVLVGEFNRLRSLGWCNPYRIVITGASLRLRPVLMTALVASLGFLPMAVSTGAGGDVQRPLATVVIGGLLLATFLTLFVIPVMYLLAWRTRRIAVAASVVCLVAAMPLSARDNAISLQAAIDTAMANNVSIRGSALNVKYYDELRRSAMPIPPAEVHAEYGQINSAYLDNRFSVSQAFALPQVYGRRERVLAGEWEQARQMSALQGAELRKEVVRAFYRVVVLRSRLDYLLTSDSIHAAFESIARERFERGETDASGKAIASNARASVALQVRACLAQMQSARLHLNNLLNATNVLEPAHTSVRLPPPITDTSQPHPTITLSQSRQDVVEARYNQEHGSLLPTFALQYNNQSLQGIGADDIRYTRSARFHSFGIGVSIPLFRAATHAAIDAAAVAVDIAGNEVAQARQELRRERQTMAILYEQAASAVDTYDSVLLPNARIVAATGDSRLKVGDINYLEWTLMQQHYVQTVLDYHDALERLNSITAELYYLNSK